MVSIIPHKPPFLFVTGVGEGDSKGFVIPATFDRKNPYIADGSDDPVVPRPLVLEALAQGIGMLAQRSFESTQNGVLAVIRDCEITADVRCSDRIELRVVHRRTYSNLWWYRVQGLKQKDGAFELVASAQIIVAHLGEGTA
jgi:3-hydroxymyristoyl/3-hydroxydecanoyl-(acyl carrier protein) dehydratase